MLTDVVHVHRSTCNSLYSWAKDETHQEEVHTYGDVQKFFD